ncbi:MAG: hypothetical protein R3F20_13430 [Planctomycetota bacterium]
MTTSRARVGRVAGAEGVGRRGRRTEDSLDATTGCLFCHAPVPEGVGRRWTCPRCREVNSQALREIYWSCHPRFRRRGRLLAASFLALPLVATAAFLVARSLATTAEGRRAALEIGAAAIGLFFLSLGPAFLALRTRRRERAWLAPMMTALGVAVAWIWYHDLASAAGLTVAWTLLVGAVVLDWAWLGRHQARAMAGELASRRAAPLPDDVVVAHGDPFVDRRRRIERAHPLPARYCLRCFSHAVEDEPGGLACRSCGAVSLPSERRDFWNRNPRLLALESVGKVLLVLTAVGVPAGIIARSEVTFAHAPRLLSVAASIAVATLAWMTLSKLTRHLPNFSASLVWTIAAALSVPIAALVGHEKAGAVGLAVGLAVSLAVLVGALFAGPLFLRFRRRLVLRGARHPDDSHPVTGTA